MHDSPITIPRLREWVAREGEFLLVPEARLVIMPGNADLRDVAAVIRSDIELETGISTSIVELPGLEARPGDIALHLDARQVDLGSEGYRLSIDSFVVIAASTCTGVFYGSRSLLQMLKVGLRIGGGEARDWPRYPERGMMVDIARRHFSREWFERHVKELAYLKMNYLHLHISDDEGFGIESSTLGLLPAESIRLSKADVAAIISLAKRYRVMVVPEIDMPGHMNAALSGNPDWRLSDRFAGKNVLDVTSDSAKAFAKQLVGEFLELFDAPYWHMGGDEVIPSLEYILYPKLQKYARAAYGSSATAKDAVLGFYADINALVRGAQRTLRVWNDDLGGGSAVALDSNIVVEWWTNVALKSSMVAPTPQQLLSDGHKIMNNGWWPTYYVPGRLLPPPVPDPRAVFERWAVNEFYGVVYLSSAIQLPPDVVAASEPGNLGAKLNVWNENPDFETIDELTKNIAARLRIIAKKTWEDRIDTATYQEFLSAMNAVGHAPGY